MVDLESILKDLESVSDEDMLRSLSALDFCIDQEKYEMAFSLYGMTKYCSDMDISELHKLFPAAEISRFRSVIVFRAYTTLVYMRSDTLERSLDKLSDNSSLGPFKRYFRSGKQPKEATLAQKIRNSMCHGSFSIDIKEISFWNGKVPGEDREKIDLSQFFDRFCPQIFRFYSMAFLAGKGASQKSGLGTVEKRP